VQSPSAQLSPFANHSSFISVVGLFHR
jgi:hypothetical protein